MEKPRNLYLRRSAALTVLAAALCLACGGLFVFLAVYFNGENLFDDEVDAIIFYVCDGFFCAVMLVCAALYFRNLTRKFVIYTDEKGIYHYSGFVHLGFIPWEEIGGITCVNGVLAFLDNTSPRLRIIPKNPDAFWKKLHFIKRYALISMSGACIKVRTFGTHVKPAALCTALNYQRDYYTANENG